MGEVAPYPAPRDGIWVPSDSFGERHNIVALSEMISRLKVTEVHQLPESDQLLVSGHGIVYEAVDQTGASKTLDTMRRANDAQVSCAIPDIVLGVEQYPEEALVRELHRGLGRTCIKAATSSESSEEFDASIDDLLEVFRFVDTPIHSQSDFQHTDLIKNENIFLPWVAASKRFRAVTPTRARAIVAILSRGMKPIKNHRDGSVQPWIVARGAGLEQRLKSAKPSKASSSKKVKSQPAKTSEKAQKSADSKSKTAFFLNTIQLTGQPRLIEDRLDVLHTHYVLGSVAFNKVPEHQAMVTVKSGLVAYLEEMSKVEPILARNIEQYVGSVTIPTFKKRVYVVADVLALLINKGSLGPRPKETVPLLGLHSSDVLRAIDTIRHTLTTRHEESERAIKIRELVTTFVQNQPLDSLKID